MGRGLMLACSCGSCTIHMNHTPLQETKVRDDKLTEELCCVEGYQASWGRECRAPKGAGGTVGCGRAVGGWQGHDVAAGSAAEGPLEASAEPRHHHSSAKRSTGPPQSNPPGANLLWPCKSQP